jgi:hypothetical protein
VTSDPRRVQRDRRRGGRGSSEPANISRGMAKPFRQPAPHFDTKEGQEVLKSTVIEGLIDR